MKFHHISIRVTDFEKSLHFYTTLTGLQVVHQFEADGGHVAYLQNGEGGGTDRHAPGTDL